MIDRQMQDDAPADGAAHHHGTVECQGAGHVADEPDIAVRRQPVLLALPAFGRRRLAVPGHVEGDHAEVPGHVRIIEHAAELAAVGAGRVQAEQRDAAAGFLDIQPVRPPADVTAEVAADDRLVARRGHGASPLPRGSSSSALNHSRLAKNGRRSPSIVTRRWRTRPRMSCLRGGGTACQKSRHAVSPPRIANDQLRPRNGPRSTRSTRPSRIFTSQSCWPTPTRKSTSTWRPRLANQGSAWARPGKLSIMADAPLLVSYRTAPLRRGARHT